MSSQKLYGSIALACRDEVYGIGIYHLAVVRIVGRHTEYYATYGEEVTQVESTVAGILLQSRNLLLYCYILVAEYAPLVVEHTLLVALAVVVFDNRRQRLYVGAVYAHRLDVVLFGFGIASRGFVGIRECCARLGIVWKLLDNASAILYRLLELACFDEQMLLYRCQIEVVSCAYLCRVEYCYRRIGHTSRGVEYRQRVVGIDVAWVETQQTAVYRHRLAVFARIDKPRCVVLHIPLVCRIRAIGLRRVVELLLTARYAAEVVQRWRVGAVLRQYIEPYLACTCGVALDVESLYSLRMTIAARQRVGHIQQCGICRPARRMVGGSKCHIRDEH